MESSLILIIDDDRDLRTLLSTFLDKNGFVTVQASGGKEFLQLFKREKFDLVLCDFILKDENGLEILKKVRTIDPICKVVMVTGYSNQQITSQMMNNGAFGYLSKPLKLDKLLKMVKAATS
jgi:two-component system response regulator HydG